jgi:hypothetical protein
MSGSFDNGSCLSNHYGGGGIFGQSLNLNSLIFPVAEFLKCDSNVGFGSESYACDGLSSPSLIWTFTTVSL